MSNLLERLNADLESGVVDPSLVREVIKEYSDLRDRINTLEELLIMIVRTGWPWGEDGEPNAIFHTSKDGFATAMSEARELLGLGHLSTITRTEPRT